MCGYCTEIYALYAITANPSHPFTHKLRSFGFIRALLLQEAQDPGALSDGFEKPPGTAESLVWLGRALQLLMRNGFDAPVYQALLAVPRFQVAVNLHCGGTKAPASTHAASPLDVDALRWLAERETWLGPGVFARRANQVTMNDCATLLTRYRICCTLMADGDEEDVIADSAAGKPQDAPELRDQFDHWLLPLMLAVARLSEPSCPDQIVRQTLLPIVKNRPKWVPNAEALELWLERQAALVLYDRFGIEPFAANLYRLRPELLQYLALTGRINAQEREQLLAAFLQRGTRGDGNFFSLHHWLVEGDFLQSVGAAID